MFKFTLKYGCDEQVIESATPVTINQVRTNEDWKAELGYGDNINILISGVAMPNEAIIPNDSIVRIETAANTKAIEG